MDYYEKMVKGVTARVDNDGDLRCLEQFFDRFGDGDRFMLKALPAKHSYSIVKLMIRCGYKIRSFRFRICAEVLPFMCSAIFHTGLIPDRFDAWHIITNIAMEHPIYLKQFIGAPYSDEEVEDVLRICTKFIGDTTEDPDGEYSGCYVVEYSFLVDMLILGL